MLCFGFFISITFYFHLITLSRLQKCKDYTFHLKHSILFRHYHYCNTGNIFIFLLLVIWYTQYSDIDALKMSILKVLMSKRVTVTLDDNCLILRKVCFVSFGSMKTIYIFLKKIDKALFDLPFV